MVEAVKHCKRGCANCFREIPWKIENGGTYKQFVGSFHDFQDWRKLNKNDWLYINKIQLQRTYKLLTLKFDYATLATLLQQRTICLLIYQTQREKHIKPAKELAVLSPVPLFLLNYFGRKFFERLQISEKGAACNEKCYQMPITGGV
jgi:hypothetical protein